MLMLQRCICCVLLALPAVETFAQADATLGASRAVIDQFGAEMQRTLAAALEQEGPVGAMAVCRDAAPEIASRLSRQAGAKVGRVSRQYRNPLNAPEPWQRSVLDELFGPTMQETDHRVEFFASRDGDVRYMRAIRLAPLCTMCHGAQLSEPVAAFLDANYPADLARGYQPGDLRGAFTVTWPGRSQPPAAP